MILTNGTIVTVDAAKPEAQALAVRGDTIVAVISGARAKARAGMDAGAIEAGTRRFIALVNQEAARQGITSWQNAGSPFRTIDVFRKVADEGGITVRLWVYVLARLGPGRAAALRSYTLNGAYAAFEEQQKGSFSPGKLADIVVLSKNIMRVPEDEIPTARVVRTIIGGRTVIAQ